MTARPAFRRATAAAVFALAVGFALSACSSSSTETSRSASSTSGSSSTETSGSASSTSGSSDLAGQTIHMLTFGVESGLGPTLKAFTQQTGIKVVPEYVTSANFPTILQTRVAAKSDIDVINVRSGAEFNKYAAAGTFAPLTDQAVLDQVSAGGKQAGTVDGKTYGFASNQFLIGVTYNKDLFQKAGISSPPVTWDNFLADCAKLKAKNIAPVSWSAADSWTNQYIYHSAIGVYAQQHPTFMADLTSGKAKWSDNTLFTTQIQRWADLKNQGYLMQGGQSLHEQDAAAAFNAGKAAMWIMGDWNLAELKPAGFTPGAFSVPLDNTSSPAPASALIDNMWAVTSWAKQPAAAQKFLEWFTQPANAKTYSEANARASTVNGVTVNLSPYQGDWNAMSASAVPFPFLISGSVNGSGPDLLSQLTAGQKSVTDVINGFQALQDTDNKAAAK